MTLRLITLILLMCSAVAAEPFKFSFGNDFLIPGGQDRFLTNILEIEAGAYGFGNEMYTPTCKKCEGVPKGDRPWDGYTYFQRKDKEKIAFGQERELTTRLGWVGHASYSDRIQTFVHDDLGVGQHPTWDGQNPSQATLDMIYLHRSREYMQSFFGNTRLTQEYGARFGNVQDYVFLDQELRKHFSKHFYVFGGLNGRAVLFNTHLDGRLIDEHIIKGYDTDTYTVEKQWFVASGRLGVEVRFDDNWCSFSYKYLTEEFKGQEGRHLYNEISCGFDF